MKLFSVTHLGVFLVVASFAHSIRAAEPLLRIDFTKPEVVGQWKALHDAAPLRAAAEGMVISIQGDDPYISGPPLQLPAKATWLTLRLKSTTDGVVEVFYFKDGPQPSQSVSASVAAGDFSDVRLPLPATGPGWHIRIDPPGTSGDVVIASAAFELREPFTLPEWPKLQLTRVDDVKQAAATVTSGPLEIRHDGKSFGRLDFRVDAEPMAVGLSPSTIGYLDDGHLKWLPASANPKVEPLPAGGFVETVNLTDAGNVGWLFRRTFTANKSNGAIDVITEIRVTRDRETVFLPLLMLLPGAGSFGEHKSQGLFPGLEYLDDEPSSSKADIVGPQSNRLVPDALKITFPLMAIGAKQRYIGMIWEQRPDVAAVFDSPDRQFSSGAHVMGLIFPGSNGVDRVEGSLLPERAVTIPAAQPLTFHQTIIGGPGASLVPAVQKYVELRGLPPSPETGMALKDYVKFAAGGWLDSKIREGNRYRHALGGDNFRPMPAADVMLWTSWLAAHTDDAPLKQRLTDAGGAAIEGIDPASQNFSGVSHIRPPVLSLLTGKSLETARAADARARGLIARFEPDGSLKYRQAPDHPDYAKTHNALDANGLTATVVSMILQDASISGDPKLIADGIRLLRAMDKFDNGVPRGAQTWEVPLHTPDILASAYLVKAYTLGYALTGDNALLDRAKYWAWTGVPFVYLINPTTKPIGPYATIAVYGATNWEAPIWMGKPVQWCGLVYADAIAQLSAYDPSGPWMQLVKGIAASGIQQSWPAATSATQQGLLPDSFEPRSQRRDGPHINPGTLEAVAIRLFDQPALYDFHRFAKFDAIVHAPGRITVEEETAELTRFTVEPWTDAETSVLIVGTSRKLSANGVAMEAADQSGRRTAPIKGKTQFTIRAE